MLFKISCCAFNFVGLDLDEKLDLVANMAFDTVDLSAKSGDELSQAGLIEEPTEYGAFVRDRAAASGLILDELFICTILQDRADVDLTTDDDAVRQHALTAFSQFCIFGQAAGFRSILVVPLAPEGDMDEATAWDNTVKMLRNFTEIAGEHDLLFNIEPVDFSLTKTPELACKMAQDVPGMGFTLDYSHWVSVGCSQEEIETMHPFTRHMHIRQAALGSRQEPVETGTIDFARVTQRLLDDDFEGTLALEHIGKLEPGYRPVDSVVRQNAELAARLEYTARRQIKTEVLPASMEASASQRTVPGEEPSAYKPEDEAWEAISLNERRLTEG
ncbi:MAG: sugar phosphate isomerase/epimerase, partial [Gemmatimonadetes bacterium]|nr:sugar phosphate isomerase/epimerase [Gemmatimonadota bacterium]